MTIADILKDARKKKGISQRKLAAKTGISLGAIQGYEQGRYKPKYEQIEKLSKILEIPISALIDPTVLTLSHSVVDLFCGNNGLEEIITSPEEKALEVSLNHAFVNLNVIGKKKIVTYAEDLNKIPEYKKQPGDPVSTDEILAAHARADAEQTTEGPEILAAHTRTDVEQTPEGVQHDLDIMNDDKNWE